MQKQEFTIILEKIIENPPSYLKIEEINVLSKNVEALKKTKDYKAYFLIALEIFKILEFIDHTIIDHIPK